VTELFLMSRANCLLRNKATGYYWDSITELKEIFLSELPEQ
jgi:hypothetical protein